MSFRGINTTVIQIRRQVFTEVARMAYANVKGEQANHLMRKIPYTIIPGEEGKLRKDIFLERAIVEERVRLAMGLPTRRMDEHNSVVSGLEDASIADKYYDPPLVNVIKFASLTPVWKSAPRRPSLGRAAAPPSIRTSASSAAAA